MYAMNLTLVIFFALVGKAQVLVQIAMEKDMLN